MSRLPKGWVINELLEVDEFQIVNIQSGFLFCFADSRVLDALSQLHMPARDNVFIGPFVTFQKQDLASLIENENANCRFGEGLFGDKIIQKM